MMFKKKKYFHLLFLVGICIFLLCISYHANAADTDHDGIDDAQEELLAEKYAPIFYFEKEEQVYPVAIEYHLSNSNLNRSTEEGNILIDPSPSIEQLSLYTNPEENYYLDNRKGTINDTGIIDDYREQMKTLGYTVYCHVIPQNEDGKNFTIIQYWMFYAFNKATLNVHEGDWEMVQVVLDASATPIKAMYSQHISGQKATWSQVEKDGNHIKVYVARGSHANYFRYYQGKLGLASDIVGKNGKKLSPEDYDLIVLGETGEANHPSEQKWIDFAGRWGDFGGVQDELRGKRGPYGPAYREEGEMWHTPLIWGNELPSVQNILFKLEWFFYHFVTIFLILAIISILIISFFIYRRYKEKGIGPRISSLLYIDGFNAKSIGNLLCIIGIVIAIVSLFFPWYTVFGDIQAGSYRTPGMVKLISIDGMEGFKVNLLETNSGLVQLGAFPLPFSLLIGIGILFFILGTIGIEKSSKAGRKYISRGIKFLVPVILIIIVILLLVNFVSQFLGGFLGGIDATQDIKDIVKRISSSPIGGKERLILPEYGSIHLQWGFETGAFLLLLAGILLLIAGVLEIVAHESFFEGAKRKL
ncbi:MAG: DUF946 domain-containing protein [Thermoplasmata archaeon]|nr:MAG: DUF946 domain-containing protein [Thermoplasmata archaeon]